MSQDSRVMLEDKLHELQRSYKARSERNRISLFIGMFCFASSPIFYLYLPQIYMLLLLLSGFLLLTVPIIRSPRRLEIDIRSLENELDFLSIPDTSIEQRAEKLFKLHQLELKNYYDLTLRHNAWIFVIGFFCIVLGFTIVGITLYFIVSSSTAKQFSEKIVLASLGAIGAALSNFIAVIYLKMHSESMKSLTEFHSRLVLTHHLHFGNFLAAEIKDETLREKTLAEIVLNLIKQSEIVLNLIKQ